MRILQICSARELGGGERHVADLANALARRGHDVYAALDPASPLVRELIAVKEQNVLELPRRHSLNVNGTLKLARFMRDRQIDLVHAHVARDYPLAVLAASRAGGVPLVITRHVLFRLSTIQKLTLRRVARVIAVSQAVASRLRAQRLFDRDKIVLVYNGIDIDRFPPRSIRAQGTSGRMRVGMIGHLAPIKGQEELVRAAAIVCEARDDVDFIIAGEDKAPQKAYQQRLEKLVEELGVTQHVRLVGWVDKVEDLLATLDLFVSPARSEPFGLTIVEAMAAGVPVIATMSEGAREIIEGDQTGTLVPIGDVEALAGAISALLSDPQARDRLGANARRVVGERFSLARMVDATERVYLQATQGE